MTSIKKNVLNKPLQPCCQDPKTGYFRDGFCHTDQSDLGRHVICAEMTEAFLSFSRSQGNDLSTPRPEFNFPGLKPGDRWCVCAERWRQAHEAEVAPPVILEACEITSLDCVPFRVLQKYALRKNRLNE